MKAWQGVIIRQSLRDESLLKDVKIIGTKTSVLENENRELTFHSIEVDDEFKDKYVQAVKKNILDSFYTHICKDGCMVVVFHDKVFSFTQSDPQLEQAREYGKSIGIIPAQMPFEHLIDHPFD